MINVSTVLRSSARPASACLRRRFPSKTKGLVTTPTVSAPTLRARSAMIGAPPVPVPPPIPAVTKTMSAPSSALRILSRSSSATPGPESATNINAPGWPAANSTRAGRRSTTRGNTVLPGSLARLGGDRPGS